MSNVKTIRDIIKKIFLLLLSGTTTNKLSTPVGLYFDEINQNLYITNTGSSDSVMRWRLGDSNGTIIAGIPGSTGSNANQLNYPMGITFDAWQNLYVSDRMNSRIQLFCNGSSTGITIAGRGVSSSNLSNAYDLKLDSRLNLYVAEYGAHRVTKFFKL